MSVETLDFKEFYIVKVDEKNIKIVRKSDNSPTSPIKVEENKDRLGRFLTANKLLEENVIEDFNKKFTEWWQQGAVNKEKVEAVLGFEFKEEQKAIPVVETEAPVEIKPAEPKAVEVPKELKEVSPKEKVTEKPKELDTIALVARFQELNKVKVPHDQILILLEGEFHIPKEKIEEILPVITPISEQIAPPSPPPSITTGVPIALPEDVVQDLKTLTTKQRALLKKLAEAYQTDEKVLVAKLVQEAEQSPVPMHWLNKLLQHAIQHKLFAVGRAERGLHATFATTEGVIEALVPSDIKLQIDQCYKIEEKGIIARCIAVSMGSRGKDLFPDLPTYKDVKLVANIGTIHKSFEIMRANLKKLSDVYAKLKTEKTTVDVVSGVVLEARGPFKDARLWYLNINDGSDLPYPYMISIEIPEENPFGIDGEQLRLSIGKTAFCYGFIKMNPAPEGFKWESIKIIPEYLLLG